MRKILLIVKREYLAAVRTVGFAIGLVVAPLLLGGSFIAVKLLEGQVDTSDKRVAVVDYTGRLSAALVEAAARRNAEEVYEAGTKKKIKPAYLLEPVAPPVADPVKLRLQLSERVRRRELHAFVEIGAGVVHPRRDSAQTTIAFYAPNAAASEVRSWLRTPINEALRKLRLTDAGIDPAAIPDLFDWLPIAGLGLLEQDQATGKAGEARRVSEMQSFGIPLIMGFLMLLMMMMGAMPLLNAVTEEKGQRIAEVLLGAVKPFEFMLGKVLGGVSVSLTGSVVYSLISVVATISAGAAGVMPFTLVPWFFAYMILAILMVGAIMAALGAACNDAKDVQSLTLPAIIPILLPTFIMVPVLGEPNSTFAQVASLFPLFSPILMLVRLSVPGGVPAWQPWAALFGMIAFAVLLIWAGGRAFRVGILLQGQPPKLGEIMKWAVRG